MWCKVNEVLQYTAFGFTADHQKVLLSHRDAIADVQLGDIVSFVPKPPLKHDLAVTSKVAFYGAHPRIIGYSTRNEELK
jgi:hypothetical protein